MEESGFLVKMEIIHLLKFGSTFAGIEVHITLNEKFVKLNYATDQFIEILRKLQQKDVHEVYIKESDCRRVLEQVSHAMSAQTFYDPDTTQEKKIDSVSSSMETVKGVIIQLGIEPETVALLKTINTRAMAILKESPSIFACIKEFKKNCSEEFLLSILTSYIMSLVIDRFPWKSEQVKEKGALASLMCDLILTKEDFRALREYSKLGTDISEKIRQHPTEIAESLLRYRTTVPIETITIILQHHEVPDGSGFPHGIKASRFNQLSAIFIVSQQFVEKLHDAAYDYGKRNFIIEDIKRRYGSTKNFDKAIDALSTVVT